MINQMTATSRIAQILVLLCLMMTGITAHAGTLSVDSPVIPVSDTANSAIVDSSTLIPADTAKALPEATTGAGAIDQLIQTITASDLVFPLILIGFLLIIILVLRSASMTLSNIYQNQNSQEFPGKFSGNIREVWKEVSLVWKVMLYLLIGFGVFYLSWQAIKGTSMEPHVTEWLNLIVRWVHVIAGIMWIGASFYFIFLENSLNRKDNLRDELAGNLWAIHGGGFYYLEKYKIAPSEIPKTLHWFKYEAYFTWISGFALLWIVYYMNASSFLIDKNVLDISPGLGIIIGTGSLLISWLIYDGMCRSSLVEKKVWFAITGFIIFTIVTYLLCQVFSSRAAYIHAGAIIGTLMVANVFFVIIPSQKALVKAAKEGKPLDPSLGKKAGLRSLHNNYLTLPVIFIMVSNHFPSTYGHEYNWAVLAGLSLASAGIKHYWNLREQGERAIWILPVSIIGILAMAIVTAPQARKSPCEDGETVSFVEAHAVISARCVSCHSATPTDEVNLVAPNNIMFDTPEQISGLADRIMARAVITKTMPQVNKTGMTQEERDILQCWIEQGAKLD